MGSGIRSRTPPSSWRTAEDGQSSRATRRRRSAASASAAQTGPFALPADPREIPDVISQALSEAGLAGVEARTAVLLVGRVYTAGHETTEHGYPIASTHRSSTARSLGAAYRWCVRTVTRGRRLRPAVAARRVDRLPVRTMRTPCSSILEETSRSSATPEASVALDALASAL